MKINITRRFVFNGKEYRSVEEMPEEARAAYERAMSSLGHSAQADGAAPARTSIKFNSQEYPDVESMPLAIRTIYKAAIGSLSAPVDAPGARETSALEAGPREMTDDDKVDYRPIEPTSSRLGWRLIVIPLALLLLALFVVSRVLKFR